MFSVVEKDTRRLLTFGVSSASKPTRLVGRGRGRGRQSIIFPFDPSFLAYTFCNLNTAKPLWFANFEQFSPFHVSAYEKTDRPSLSGTTEASVCVCVKVAKGGYLPLLLPTSFFPLMAFFKCGRAQSRPHSKTLGIAISRLCC